MGGKVDKNPYSVTFYYVEARHKWIPKRRVVRRGWIAHAENMITIPAQ